MFAVKRRHRLSPNRLHELEDLVATLAAGLYPAWRVGRLPPAMYLKSQ